MSTHNRKPDVSLVESSHEQINCQKRTIDAINSVPEPNSSPQFYALQVSDSLNNQNQPPGKQQEERVDEDNNTNNPQPVHDSDDDYE